MKFVSSFIAASLLLGASAAYAGSDDGSRDTQGFGQAVSSQGVASRGVANRAPAPAAAAAQQASDYSRFEHQVVQP